MAKRSGPSTRHSWFGTEKPVGWRSRVLSWKGRVSAVAFMTMVVVMGFSLHGSLAGRLIEGAVMVTAMIVLWLIGTRPAAQPPDDRTPGDDVDR